LEQKDKTQKERPAIGVMSQVGHWVYPVQIKLKTLIVLTSCLTPQ